MTPHDLIQCVPSDVLGPWLGNMTDNSVNHGLIRPNLLFRIHAEFEKLRVVLRDIGSFDSAKCVLSQLLLQHHSISLMISIVLGLSAIHLYYKVAIVPASHASISTELNIQEYISKSGKFRCCCGAHWNKCVERLSKELRSCSEVSDSQSPK